MNVGGVDVLDAFGGIGKSKRLETTRYATKVRWLGLRPSQLDKLKSSNSPESRKLTHTSFFNALRKFGKHRNTRLDNHLKAKTGWIQNGGEQASEQSSVVWKWWCYKAYNTGWIP